MSDLSYNETYLEGDSGNQGLDTVLDELNAYTWSLLTEVAVADQRPSNMTSSARDGLLAFMLYLETYLLIAREDEQSVYEAISENEDTRQVILTLWDRARCALSLSGDDPSLGIRDGEISTFVFGDRALQEVERLRAQ